MAADDMISAINPTKLFLLADDSIKALVQDGLVGCFKQPEHYSRYVDADWKLLQSMKLYPLAPAVTNRTPIDIYTASHSSSPSSLVVGKFAMLRWGWKRYFTDVPDDIRQNLVNLKTNAEHTRNRGKEKDTSEEDATTAAKNNRVCSRPALLVAAFAVVVGALYARIAMPAVSAPISQSR
jgi:hypothetical protein